MSEAAGGDVARLQEQLNEALAKLKELQLASPAPSPAAEQTPQLKRATPLQIESSAKKSKD